MALILVAWWLYGEYGRRAALRDIEITVQGARVLGVDLTSADLEFTLRSYNPNDVDAVLDRAEFDVYVEGVYVGHGSIPERVEVLARSTRYVEVLFTVEYPGLGKAVRSAFEKLLAGRRSR